MACSQIKVRKNTPLVLSVVRGSVEGQSWGGFILCLPSVPHLALIPYPEGGSLQRERI